MTRSEVMYPNVNVIWFGSHKNGQVKLCPELNLKWDNCIFTILGVKFTTNLSEVVDINYNDEINEREKILCSWSKRKLTQFGKLVVIKSLDLANINHLIMGIRNPPQEKVNLG